MWQTILANMLFNKDTFKLHGSPIKYTLVEEPTLYPVAKQVSLHTKLKSGEHRTLRLEINATVEVWDTSK